MRCGVLLWCRDRLLGVHRQCEKPIKFNHWLSAVLLLKLQLGGGSWPRLLGCGGSYLGPWLLASCAAPSPLSGEKNRGELPNSEYASRILISDSRTQNRADLATLRVRTRQGKAVGKGGLVAKKDIEVWVFMTSKPQNPISECVCPVSARGRRTTARRKHTKHSAVLSPVSSSITAAVTPFGRTGSCDGRGHSASHDISTASTTSSIAVAFPHDCVVCVALIN